MKVGVLILDTGYFGVPPQGKGISILQRDYCHMQIGIPGIVPGYIPRKDGSDSVMGSGTQSCNEVATLLNNTSNFKILSVKVGDSSTPLLGVSPTAVEPALAWVSGLTSVYPGWNWVCYLNYDVTGIKETYKVAAQLQAAKIPLVVPVGQQGINLDQLSLNINSYPHIMTVALNNSKSDYGAASVTLATSSIMSAVADVARARFDYPNASAADVINVVKGMTKPDASWANRSITGGLL